MLLRKRGLNTGNCPLCFVGTASFHDERNKVLSQLVIDEQPGAEKLINEVRPWIELYLAHYKKISCLADLA